MAITWGAFKDEVAALGQLDTVDDANMVSVWAKGGLNRYVNAGAFVWLKNTFEVTLVEGQYSYPFNGHDGDDTDDFATDLFRFDTKSLRFGGKRTYLIWTPSHLALDASLGPDWKDSATDNAGLQYATRFGNNLWVAKKPSASFIADHPTLYGYYWRSENTENGDAGILYLPDTFLEHVVIAALAYGLKTEDDPEWSRYQDLWRTVYLPEMFSATLDVGANDQMLTPNWANYDHDGFGQYGDGAVVDSV